MFANKDMSRGGPMLNKAQIRVFFIGDVGPNLFKKFRAFSPFALEYIKIEYIYIYKLGNELHSGILKR